MTEELNFKAICSLTTNVMGLPEGSLSFNNRTRNIQAARSVAGYIGLKEENIDRKIIAKILKRDRTATYHYENTHHKNFKHCIVYRNTFTKVYKKYKDISSELFSPKYLRPRENKYFDKEVILDLFIDSIRFKKDFLPNPSNCIILSL